MRQNAPSIESFRWELPWLARGGQPDEDGFRLLERAHGITHIINLRTHSETDVVERTTRYARSIHYPVKNDEAPTEEQALRWLDLCALRSEHQRFFVHCQAGHGRTSTFCVLVHLAMGEELDDAIELERRYGFDPDGKHERQAEFLRRFAERLKSGDLSVGALSAG